MAKVKQWLKYGLIAFLIFYLISQPEASADVIQTGLGGLMGAAESLSRFVNALSV
ncbi:hypothetical protein CLV63_115135 [Murinocardiopsis flavida]|uniref:Uncharacterized protein n=1 Tax=Murinocardiopsis flavida TaxID=645275 RepID=A0A2P8DE50_9ACTN|nr:hypothetical protein [Murinocardiopsis flavida]PSK95472.1 hypothetical protein CLV63_115135 [Murinocardiopsis flavida]